MRPASPPLRPRAAGAARHELRRPSGLDGARGMDGRRLQELNNPSYEALANKEAARLRERSNKPAYCQNRYYKAMAGGDGSVCAD